MAASSVDNMQMNGDDETELVWEYEVSKGKWVRYNDEIRAKLNSDALHGTIDFELDEAKLQVDLNTMKQKDLDTNFVRSVRCAVPENKGAFRVWEYRGVVGRWKCFNPLATVHLQEALKSGCDSVKIKLEDTDFSADFVSNSLKRVDGSVEYKLRSQMSEAEPAVTAKPAPGAWRTRAAKRVASAALETAAAQGKGKKFKSVRKSQKEAEVSVVNDKGREKRKVKEETIAKKCGKNGKQGENDKEEDNDITEEKLAKHTVIMKGLAPVDSECKEKLGEAHVYCEGNDVYDALLTQTCTQSNNNKYYILQLIEDDKVKRYSVWFRWGRVGYKGQTSFESYGNNLERAKLAFCNKFRDKTRNSWSARAQFVKAPKLYDYIPKDYAKLIKEQKKDNESEEVKPPLESKLDPRLQHLIKLLCDVRAMEETLLEMEYDSKKCPLGKVTDEQIKSGYTALKKIESFIEKEDFSAEFMEAVDDYFTKIPHFFGMRKPPLIKTREQLKAEISLLEALTDVSVAVRTFKKEKECVTIHPIDQHYMNMRCSIAVISADDPQYKLVDNYLQLTHGSTHNLYRMRINKLFAVDRNEERENFKFDLGNRMLLWHGSRLTNWYGILSQGLRIAPPEAPSTGYMFGKGIYFADMSSKSANYCYPQTNKPGFLVLAQVALGAIHELYDADYEADKLPKGKNSTKGLGKFGPDPNGYITLDDGCVVPCSKPVDLLKSRYSLNYNEYIVYDVKQVWIRYLIEVDFLYE